MLCATNVHSAFSIYVLAAFNLSNQHRPEHVHCSHGISRCLQHNSTLLHLAKHIETAQTPVAVLTSRKPSTLQVLCKTCPALTAYSSPLSLVCVGTSVGINVPDYFAYRYGACILSIYQKGGIAARPSKLACSRCWCN